LKEPVFLGLDEITEIHNDQIKRYGGRTGIRDLELLKSAVAMPKTGFGEEYFHTDFHEMAAAYLFHLVRNHPFIDGNKRSGAVSAIIFLILNGIDFSVDEDSLVNLVISVAEGKIDRLEIALYFRKNSRSRE
jgi:death-on-curing protein